METKPAEQPEKITLQAILRHPIILLFFIFLALFVVFDLLTPDRASSELENRTLAQTPVFDTSVFAADVENLSSVRDNYEAFAEEWRVWTTAYNDYAKDQLLLRDEWISMHSLFETAQGKLENGGVWYAKDGYLISKDDTFTSAQEATLAMNTSAVCELAQRHGGKVTAMVIPSPANVLSDKLRWNPPQVDENAMLDGIFSDFETAGAQVVDLRAPLLQAHLADDTQSPGSEPFYRTDHHWTTDGGARVAYEAFCASQGLPPVLPAEELLNAVPDFYGTNYARSKRIGTQPDTLYYYDLPNQLTVYKYQDDDSILAEPGPLMDKTKLGEYDKYAAFLRGNNGYSEITGNGEGSILVIKDSYGNSFAPYLVENYAKIGIIDLRAWPSVDETIADGEYESILVLYSFENFTSDAYARRMMTDLQ